MFARRNKHYPCRSRQTSLAAVEENFTKPVAKNNFGPSALLPKDGIREWHLSFLAFLVVLWVPDNECDPDNVTFWIM